MFLPPPWQGRARQGEAGGDMRVYYLLAKNNWHDGRPAIACATQVIKLVRVTLVRIYYTALMLYTQTVVSSTMVQR